jgi:hypothetical protein
MNSSTARRREVTATRNPARAGGTTREDTA